MRLHILGLCGTFMSGIAILAKQRGHTVSGSDMNVYPPMSTQLQGLGIEIMEGYSPDHISPLVDCVIVGNVITRGNEAIEHVLAKRLPYQSGPAWLFDNVLKDRTTIAIAGTHGKTTTTSLVAWILGCAGANPGFLVGGVPENFGVSARLGGRPFFVIEADEYDSAFFDKRSKFMHYQPQTAILNNLEYDHADIFPDLAAVKLAFHHFVRTIPGNGLIIRQAKDDNLTDVLQMGCWTPVERFGGPTATWQAMLLEKDGSRFILSHHGREVGEVNWDLLGEHNVNNALAALAASHHAGVALPQAIAALASFKNVKRRLEVKGKIKDIVIYDDFAHHPSAIATTLAGLREKIGKQERLIAVLEFGSYTMRTGVHKDRLMGALKEADLVVVKNTDIDWGLQGILSGFPQPTTLCPDVDTIVEQLVPTLHAGDHVIVMSNSGFGGIHQKLLEALEKDEVCYTR